MFKWLEKRFSNTQREEAQRFLDSLRGAEDGVVDMASATAMYWAAYYQAKGTDLYEMEAWIEDKLLFPMELGSGIKELQKSGSSASAVGLMVWLHSARALMYPELRMLGRDIWSELVKASEEADDMADEMVSAAQSTTGVPLILSFKTDRHRVPMGLGPITR